MKPPFDIEDIEHVHVVIEAKGKTWIMTPKRGRESGNINIALAVMLLESHNVVEPCLEEIQRKYATTARYVVIAIAEIFN